MIPICSIQENQVLRKERDKSNAEGYGIRKLQEN